MKRKKHNAEQIIKKLREADAMLAGGKTIGQACQALEISEQTFHRWRNQYGGMKAEEAKRLKELEDENKRTYEVNEENILELLSAAERRALYGEILDFNPIWKGEEEGKDDSEESSETK